MNSVAYRHLNLELLTLSHNILHEPFLYFCFQGAVIGGIIGLALPLWISFGAYDIGVSDPYLNTSVSMCFPAPNLTGGPWDRDSDEIFRYGEM